jgi:signal recognition particle subunit SRP72
LARDGDGEAVLLRSLNSAVLRTLEENPFLALRLVEDVLPKDTENMFTYQRTKLDQLKAISSLRAQKLCGIGSGAGRSEETEFPHLSLVMVAADARLAQNGDALRTCQRLMKSRPLDLGLVLAAIQLHLRKKDTGSAAAALESYLRRLESQGGAEHAHVRFLPGLVALAVSLYRVWGRGRQARAELAYAAEHHAKTKGVLSTGLLREAGLELVTSLDEADAAVAGTAFNEVLKMVLDDVLSMAGSVAAASTTGDTAREKYVDQLPASRELVGDADIRSLLGAGVVSTTSPAGQAKRKHSPMQTEGLTKKRRRRMPKNVEDGKQPDPERWLPLRDRSSYRPKGKKGKKKAHEATQGGVVKEEETLELVGGAGAVKVEKASNAPSKKKKKARK